MSFMNSIKCNNCGLTNFADVFDCRRCGQSLFASQPKPKRVGKKPRPFSVWSLLMIAIVVGIVYYFYNGVQTSMQELEIEEQKRLASQPKNQPTGLSRSQAEQQRTGTYGNLVSNSQSLKDHQNRVDETQKVMNQVSNSQSSK